jgi:hypothetical protein
MYQVTCKNASDVLCEVKARARTTRNASFQGSEDDAIEKLIGLLWNWQSIF